MRKVIIGLVILSGVFFAVVGIIIILVLQKAKEIDFTTIEDDTEVVVDDTGAEDEEEIPEDNEPTDLPGTEVRPSEELEGDQIFDEDFETALMKARYSYGNDSSCISGDAISGFGAPIIADLDEGDIADLKARLATILDSDSSAEALYTALATINKPVSRLCVVSDDLTVVLTRMYFPTTDGGTQYRYDLFVLPKDVFDEFEVESGDALYGGTDTSLVLWRDIDDSSINELPAVAVISEDAFSIKTWDVYSIDTFFGEFDHIESCGVTAVGGVKKMACGKIYE